MSKYDVIIIGGGHNGLVCASYLAKRKCKILVLEKNSELGGLANCANFANSFSKKIISDLNISIPQINKSSYIVGLNPDSNHTIVEENKNGFIVNNITEISDKIIQLSLNRDLRITMSKESRKIYLNRFKACALSASKYNKCVHKWETIKLASMQWCLIVN